MAATLLGPPIPAPNPNPIGGLPPPPPPQYPVDTFPMPPLANQPIFVFQDAQSAYDFQQYIDNVLGYPSPPSWPPLAVNTPQGPGWTFTEYVPQQNPNDGTWGYTVSDRVMGIWPSILANAIQLVKANVATQQDASVAQMGAPAMADDSWLPPGNGTKDAGI